VLRERSFLWLVGSRLFVLAGIAVLSKLAVFYLTRTMGLGESEKAVWVPATLLMIGVVTLVSTIPAARLSDRIGRKSVIYASTTFGMVGAAILALAPNVWIAEGGVVLIAIAAGSFLSVDWALMTDIIPKASSGRYMGISNVATACAGPVALLTGGLLMDVVGGPEEAGSGPRAAMVVAVGLFALGAILLRPVREERVEDVSADGATGYPLRDAVVETEQAVL
jgi:MFS family permease